MTEQIDDPAVRAAIMFTLTPQIFEGFKILNENPVQAEKGMRWCIPITITGLGSFNIMIQRPQDNIIYEPCRCHGGHK